jgi:hypothetical protein
MEPSESARSNRPTPPKSGAKKQENLNYKIVIRMSITQATHQVPNTQVGHFASVSLLTVKLLRHN